MRVIVIGVCVVLALASCGGPARRTVPPTQAQPVEVVYRVGGSGEASLTYRNATGGTEQRSVSPPWALPFQAPAGTFLYIAAQTTAGGVATCVILVDGQVVSRAEARGDYRIATCEARAE